MKFRSWVREQVSQIQGQRLALDNMYHQIAALARLAKIKPEKLVAASQDLATNYEYLRACMTERLAYTPNCRPRLTPR